jgi:hypothetical protein
VIAQAENIHLNITQHFGFHLTQILQQGLDLQKRKIFRQRADAVVKGLISVFEVQLNIPPEFPQSPGGVTTPLEARQGKALTHLW